MVAPPHEATCSHSDDLIEVGIDAEEGSGSKPIIPTSRRRYKWTTKRIVKFAAICKSLFVTQCLTQFLKITHQESEILCDMHGVYITRDEFSLLNGGRWLNSVEWFVACSMHNKHDHRNHTTLTHHSQYDYGMFAIKYKQYWNGATLAYSLTEFIREVEAGRKSICKRGSLTLIIKIELDVCALSLVDACQALQVDLAAEILLNCLLVLDKTKSK
ncbi:hypothetical protein CK203_115990 [Vitis vinifera]|uniref:Uncharacterized protein n=1 Tax=Vitis vinifera TaxID=29760 RepID=A0A438CU00_VITVI|nr:hypothetical protein CK203_115990 [Vitis vinifera]